MRLGQQGFDTNLRRKRAVEGVTSNAHQSQMHRMPRCRYELVFGQTFRAGLFLLQSNKGSLISHSVAATMLLAMYRIAYFQLAPEREALRMRACRSPH